MRIAIIAHLKFAIGEPFAGGLEMHTHMLARSLRERGHDVTLFASTRSDPALGVEAICDETSLLETGIAEANDVAFFREHHAYLGLMTKLRSRSFDVIHNNSLHYLPVSMAETLATPVLTTLHTPPFCWLESGVRLNRGPMTYVAVSQATADMWSHVAKTDHVIPNGIDLTHFPYQPVASETPYLVWYGRIVPEKGLDYAIDAARLAGLPLRIAGPVSNQSYFDEKIAPHLGAKVEYVGHLSHRELARLVGGAIAALCTPRWEEPYGLVVAEALACGTPVAAFRRGGVPALLSEDCGVLAQPDDVASLASAALAASVLSRSACRAHAERYCDAQRMVDEYEAVYRQLALASVVAHEPQTATLIASVA
ncbi:glycosyltransferase family 4 protein (plasmid) [Novosphingobium resinovorum]|uniref:glycosyltransferase family 4 protein n=1 Tax=Novosphingobium TaxID=165696 RepID=UPI002003F8CB|nr:MULTISPECIES: glycosyltransferase family 4 protein [Novosphingobium]MBF7015417.1 glycosyltransferase family 4 protein [Novosphingobium sp. HR1a]WJM30096.1 glycosyltransferase family 4 protein [Novosphingobium resinovorum]